MTNVQKEVVHQVDDRKPSIVKPSNIPDDDYRANKRGSIFQKIDMSALNELKGI